ncbi:hypothetical protein, partial [Alistipes sp.]|uniref:hypothetical protein n=1 Tax=Alistipes sp. TaxID=1872444 RepID=UPI00284FB53B
FYILSYTLSARHPHPRFIALSGNTDKKNLDFLGRKVTFIPSHIARLPRNLIEYPKTAGPAPE